MDYLFVYGTLAPGRPNQHILADVKGTWTKATIKGKLYQEGWGAAEGYPGIVLDNSDAAAEVEGWLFASQQLAQHWSRLDAFEGEGYRRELTEVTTIAQQTFSAYVYVLNR